MKGQRMPKEKIAQTFVDNGADGTHVNSVLITWGPNGGAPDAPNGWVNAGFAHLAVSQDNGTDEPDIDHYVVLDAAAMDHLIRTLKKIRAKTFDKQRLAEARAKALTDNETDFHLKSVGLG